MGYFNMTYYDSLMHSGTKRDLNGTSISKEKGTDGKANNTSAYNHEYYMRNKEKWGVEKEETIKEISDFTGMKEESIRELRALAKGKGVDSPEYKKLLSELAEGDSAQAKKIEDTLKKEMESGEKEFDVDAAAMDVIRGKYKNGAERKAALGDDYEMVQKRVNEIMKKGGGSSKPASSDTPSDTKESDNSSGSSGSSGSPARRTEWYHNSENKVFDAQEKKKQKEQEKTAAQ